MDKYVECHRNLYWRNKEVNNDNYNMTDQPGARVRNRVSIYATSLKKISSRWEGIYNEADKMATTVSLMGEDQYRRFLPRWKYGWMWRHHPG